MAEKKLKRVWNKQVKIAFGVVIAAIILAVPVGVATTMNRIYDQVAAVFQSGAEGDNLSIQNDLSARAAAAVNLTAVAKRYMDGDSEAIQSVVRAAKALEEAEGPSAKYAANEALGEAFTLLYDSMEWLALTEKDSQYRESLSAEMKSRGVTIANDPYNQRAEEYNQRLDSFPTNLLGKALGLKRAELFAAAADS